MSERAAGRPDYHPHLHRVSVHSRTPKYTADLSRFTPDHLPWVGQIPNDITGREGNGEWIAAGFNGYGMPLCWGCGEAVAKMILGKEEEVSEWLPTSFLITPKRLKSPYSSTEAGVAGLLGQSPDWITTAKLVGQHAVNVVRDTLFK